jgi:hypothetical protein
LGYFINGVQNNINQADMNRIEIEALVRNSPSTKDIYFYLAYSRTAGVSDFKDVLAQKQREFSQLTAKEFILFVLQGTLPSWVSAGNAVRFQESMRDGLRNALHGNFDQGDFDQIYGGIKFNLTGQGKEAIRLLLVAHSQGNLYANAVYEKLINQEKVTTARAVRYYGIAPATGYVAGEGSKYILSDRDAVINGLRLAFPVVPNNASPGLFASLASASDWSAATLWSIAQGHSLTDVYLNSGINMRSRIGTEMRGLANQLKARYAGSWPAGGWMPGVAGWPNDPWQSVSSAAAHFSAWAMSVPQPDVYNRGCGMLKEYWQGLSNGGLAGASTLYCQPGEVAAATANARAQLGPCIQATKAWMQANRGLPEAQWPPAPCRAGGPAPLNALRGLASGGLFYERTFVFPPRTPGPYYNETLVNVARLPRCS